MASRNVKAIKAEKQAEYERLCRTPGTPQHAARMRRLEEASRVIERREINDARTLRREVAAASLETQRRVIDMILKAQTRTTA